MPRIRTIKPEFWSSPDVAQLSAVARLTFIGMWNWADDTGRGTLNLKELEGFIFPFDDIPTLSGGTSENFRRVVAEVSEACGVVIYRVDGRDYYAIPSWSKHQRNERTAKAKYPAPSEGEIITDQWCSGTSDTFRRGGSELPRTSVLGTGEQGNRGTGEQGVILINPADAGSIDPPSLDEAFAEFWTIYPRHVAKKAARTKFAKAVKEAGGPQPILEGARRYAEAVKGSDPAFIAHPTTWLNQGRWTDEHLSKPSASRNSAGDGTDIADWLGDDTPEPIDAEFFEEY